MPFEQADMLCRDEGRAAPQHLRRAAPVRHRGGLYLHAASRQLPGRELSRQHRAQPGHLSGEVDEGGRRPGQAQRGRRGATAVHMPTAIDNMDGSHPFIKTLASLPIAPGVEAHSIVAVQGDGPPEEGDDGVVKYTSAHIDGVASELIVRDGHSTQATPATIEEVRRLLYAHLKEQ